MKCPVTVIYESMAKDVQASVVNAISVTECIFSFIELNLSSYKLWIRVLIFFLDGIVY